MSGSPAADYEDKRLDINEYLVRNPVSTFFFSVEGDSMQGAETTTASGAATPASERQRAKCSTPASCQRMVGYWAVVMRHCRGEDNPSTRHHLASGRAKLGDGKCGFNKLPMSSYSTHAETRAPSASLGVVSGPS